MSALKIPVFVSLLVQTLMVLTNVAVPLDMCCEPTRKHVQVSDTNLAHVDVPHLSLWGGELENFIHLKSKS